MTTGTRCLLRAPAANPALPGHPLHWEVLEHGELLSCQENRDDANARGQPRPCKSRARVSIQQLQNRNQTSSAPRLLQELQACRAPAAQLSWAAFSHPPSVFPSLLTQLNFRSVPPSWQIIPTLMLRGDGRRFWTASSSHLLSGPGSGQVATRGAGMKVGNLQKWNGTQKSKASRRSWF